MLKNLSYMETLADKLLLDPSEQSFKQCIGAISIRLMEQNNIGVDEACDLATSIAENELIEMVRIKAESYQKITTKMNSYNNRSNNYNNYNNKYSGKKNKEGIPWAAIIIGMIVGGILSACEIEFGYIILGIGVIVIFFKMDP